MQVLLAGATGAIGRPLIRALTANGHDVSALVRKPDSHPLVRELGAEPITADVLDRDSLLRALDGVAADAVIHEATALRDAKVQRRIPADDPTGLLRTVGTANLLAATDLVGARRFIAQSLVLGYGYHDHGARPVTERDEFGVYDGGVADEVVRACVAGEQQVFDAPGVDGIALRYGLFYGPSAFSDLFADMMRKHAPVGPLGSGGVNTWIHVEDAAAATVAALERGVAGRAYNIADDNPITWREFFAEVHRHLDTPRPIKLPAWMIRLAVPYIGALMSDTSMRISSELAHEELGWRPRYASVASGLAAH
ncbi:epimerase [Nocardia neocaledoniensis NBRC 108232]|uniref:Nucleoside-diphosphate-sugar epimerase n=1 Tax=Nocardia neocaledoniensis TaxID=236511 RepID=A0A317NLI5_9NOCA|nr:NAD-dependent epimerase/dehydratase family protein [Nocardia neocaledoniensis]PWV76206.1 nucleoside-diphosphate-sugar epimerase [Nocardia neocaledoniensis]GEM31207.1 epimerase [Nocardia neocaledoniensis NBRC 108232]